MSSTNTASHAPAQPAPGPRGHWLWGNLGIIGRDPIGLFTAARQRWGDVVHLRGMGSIQLYLIAHPNDIEQVLRTNAQNYPKGYFNRRLALVGGQGVLTSDGKLWRRQRHLIRPAFHKQRLAALAATITATTEHMFLRWQATNSDQPLDIAAAMLRLTLDIVGQALLSTDLGDDANALGGAITTGIAQINHHILHPLALPDTVPTPRNLRFRRAIHTLDTITHGIIQTRRTANDDGDDLLGMFLGARDEAGMGMNDRQLRDEVVTLILAGHETPAVALGWLWYLLAQHPDIEDNLHAELDAVLGGRTPTIDDLPQLPYLRMVIDETLRLYPPLWAMGRQAQANDAIQNYRIPAGALVAVSPYVTHRHPLFWDDPAAFWPERWANKDAAELPHFAYFPFGGGPRQCIGNHFALLEMQLIVAMIMQRFRLQLATPGPVAAIAMGTLRPRGGLPMRLEARG